MLKEKRLVPQLRFSEFEGEWVEKKLGNVTTKVGSGSTPKGGIEVYTKTGIPFIRSQNVYDNQLQLDDIHIPKSIHKKMAGSTVLSNDILLNITGASIGRSCIVPYDFEEGNVNQHVSIIRLKEGTPEFLQAILSSEKGQKLVYQSMTGSGREGLNFQSIRSFKIVFPKPKEQQKIANFLSAIDNRIQTLVKKKTLLEQYKKGVMQEVFKQELRFKDDTSTTLSASDGKAFPEWEEKKLGQTGNIKKGKQLNKEELTLSGTYPCQNGGISPSGYTEEYNTVGNTITISEGGNSCGYVNYMQSKFWCGGHCYSILELKKEVNALFLFQYLKFNEYGIMRLRVGSGLPNIQKKDLLMFEVKLPCIEEQTKIANFLSAIDRNIELVTKKIEHTKTYKKGLLQQMFV